MATDALHQPMKQPVIPFNFSRAGQFTHDQLRTLRVLEEQFARNLTHTLGAWLRTNIIVLPLAAEQQVFSQWAENIATGHHFMPLRIEPLQLRGLLSMDLRLAPAIIDLLLGGSGRIAELDRELTEIEDAVLGSVLDIVLKEWGAAWLPYGLEFFIGPKERDGQSQRIMPVQERVYVARYQVTFGDLTGQLAFCTPSGALASRLRAVAEDRDRARQKTEDERGTMATRLSGATVHAALHFPSMRLQATDLRELAPGALLPLPLGRDAVAELRAGGMVLSRATPVRSGDHRAARIGEPMDGVQTAARVTG